MIRPTIQPLFFALLTLAALSSGDALAQPTTTSPNILGDGTLLHGPLDTWRHAGSHIASKEPRTVAVDDERAPFDRAIEVTVAEDGLEGYDVQLCNTITEPVAAGDVVLVQMFLRVLSTTDETGGEAQTELLIQSESGGEVLNRVSWAYDREWKQYSFPLVAKEAYRANVARIQMRFGYAKGVYQIGGVSIRRFPNTVDMASLPKTEITYEGQSPDAAWREAAQERIRKYRMAPLTVVVRGEDGEPIPGANVSVRLKQHAFNFGTSDTFSGQGYSNQRDKDASRRIAAEYFNLNVAGLVTWRWWEESESFRSMDALMADNRRDGLRTHAAHIVWDKWSRIPQRVYGRYQELARQDADAARDYLSDEIARHVDEKTRRLKGKCDSYNVINEHILLHGEITNVVGMDAAARWFKIARENDPDVLLFVNDSSIITGGDMNLANQRKYYEFIESLRQHGAPVDAVGFQGHFRSMLTPPERLYEIFDEFSRLGLRLEITEFDVCIENEPQLLADYYRDFYTICFSHPDVQGVTQWGHWAPAHWRPPSAMFNKDWTLRPHGEVYKDLVLRQWRTDENGRTDDRGRFTTPGFLGTYEIVVTHPDGKEEVREASLTQPGATVEIAMPPYDPANAAAP